MKGRLAQAWQKLISDTVGTDRYWWIALLHAAFYEDMDKAVTGCVRGRVLDMGAGQMAWKRLLCSHSEDYFSGDVVRGHPDLDVIFDVTAGLPFADGTFNTVFCCSVLEHVKEPTRAFAEMHRVLTRQGVTIVSLPFVYNLHDEPYDYYRFTRYGIEYLAEATGFEVEKMVVSGGIFHLVLNLPSAAMATVWASLGLHSLIRPTTRFWLALARKLDRVGGLREIFASNHIAILRKRG
jgi:SAM-dependent methyltransferase